jgi:hypothetical protein
VRPDWVGGLAVVWTLSHVLIYYVSVTHRRILDMDVESLREYLMNIENEEIAAERARSRGFKWFWNLKKAAVDESITTGSKRMSYVLKKDDEDIRYGRGEAKRVQEMEVAALARCLHIFGTFKRRRLSARFFSPLR